MRASTVSIPTMVTLLLGATQFVDAKQLSRRCIAKCEDDASPYTSPLTGPSCVNILVPHHALNDNNDPSLCIRLSPILARAGIIATGSQSPTPSSSVYPSATATYTADSGAADWHHHGWDGNGTSTASLIKATTTSWTTSSTRSSSAVATPSAGAYQVRDKFSGSSFFDGFNFDDFADPTHGNVNYVTQDKATRERLAFVQNGIATIKVDNTSTVPAGGNRDSVRISSQNSYSSGLIILDVQSVPYGCGVWPAFWTVGDNWPSQGEIDIVEGVNTQTNAQYTLHTAPGCNIDLAYEKSASGRRRRQWGSRSDAPPVHTKKSAATSPMAFSGKVMKSTCDATTNSNEGCGIQDPDDASFGQGLNDNGGGVFATLLDADGVAIWFFPRSSIPDDVTSGSPTPSTWPNPKAFWSSSSCPTKNFFGPQRIVINTTLCGDWAGGAFASAGCGNSCANYVQDPSNFDNAKWEIHSVTVYDVPS